MAFKNNTEISFKHKAKGLDEERILLCKEVIIQMQEAGAREGYIYNEQISIPLGITPYQFRKCIQLIREYNEEFIPGEFIVANKNGYHITTNKKLIKKFSYSIQKRAISALAQTEQAFKLGDKNGTK